MKFSGTNLRNLRTKTNGQHQFWKKNRKNLIFFKFFQINHTFSVWNWILYEKCFLLRYCMLKYLKNYKIWNFYRFSWKICDFWSIFNFCISFTELWKNILQKAQKGKNWYQLLGEHFFFSFWMLQSLVRLGVLLEPVVIPAKASLTSLLLELNVDITT